MRDDGQPGIVRREEALRALVGIALGGVGVADGHFGKGLAVRRLILGVGLSVEMEPACVRQGDGKAVVQSVEGVSLRHRRAGQQRQRKRRKAGQQSFHDLPPLSAARGRARVIFS